MRMIPETPYRTHSSAEMRVFDKLRAAFTSHGDQTLVAYHSLNLPWHERKRFGEIDFLIVGQEGVYVLEVKGGRVKQNNGRWSAIDRLGRETPLKESPFLQAEGALHGLVGKLRKDFPEWSEKHFTIGYGVLFPDCEWRTSSAEWDDETVGDLRQLRDMEAWLGRFFHYWQEKCRHVTGASLHESVPNTETWSYVSALQNHIRPNFETAIPLQMQMSAVEERVAHLTRAQMVLLDVVRNNPRVLCSGGAGTGKTFMAMELARRWTAEGESVLLACHSRWLKQFLESRGIAGLTVASIDEIPVVTRRSGIYKFDSLIVDEGQDLFDRNSMDRLDDLLVNGLEWGKWAIFFDMNNQAGLAGNADPTVLKSLNNVSVTSLTLCVNCRNTQVILDKVKEALGADMGVTGAGAGPKIREYMAPDQTDSVRYLEQELKWMMESGGITPGQITILSPFPFQQSTAALLPPKIMDWITILDEYSLRTFPPNKISFAEIINFKGLENDVAIVIDLQEPGNHRGPLNTHYVAMSRPRALLSLIYSAQ